MAETAIKRLRQKKTGLIVSAKMAKTVVVEVRNRVGHAKYKKYFTTRSRLKAHAEETYQPGDIVEITECRPLSKTKRWRVTKLISRKATNLPEISDTLAATTEATV